ncbi:MULTISPECIES: pectinesterase family protein [unclassified Streptomyces]|uniref:pectinesterase family protein n=1 Tax=unclassified Streptomyces TaxID=2593676 RepID=UPI002E80F020|nr:pectinesterase family protein [Streptomyces sp. NBC_00589]WTI35365.1 pectinesterase family protein [Streptomyces sp. NBC_00775]WUB30961.1 pectinesterase family protein [Streptomyces sp. NBC_00589]
MNEPTTHRLSPARRRATAVATGTAAALGLAAVPLVTQAQAATVITVAKDGSGQYTTVQAAVNAAAAGDTVSVAEGTYTEIVNVPVSKTGLTIKGATGNAEDVVITYDRAAGYTDASGNKYGTLGSSVATFSAGNLTVTGITVRNTFDKSAHPEITDTQAVAVTAQGDRQTFTNDRFISRQDTVLNWSPSSTGQYRQYFYSSFISGDVDFVFGNATAVYDRVNIQLRDSGAAAGGLNGFLSAPNTSSAKTYGILVTGSSVSSSAAANTYYLGRPWHPTSDAVGQLVIRQTSLPAAVKVAGPWTDMSGYSWKNARFFEYKNTGAGATVNSNRPQLTDSQASNYTAQKYLAGTDGWNPVR